MNRHLLLLETIRLEDGELKNLSWHQHRMRISSLELWGSPVLWDLKDGIFVPDSKRKGLYKVRVVYGPDTFRQQVVLYKRRNINTLKLVYADHLDYHLKFEDRSELEKLKIHSAYCDEILIVRDGLIPDTSYSNVALFDGETWYTPKSPLLNGTCRERLLMRGKLREADIRPIDLENYREIRLINAMIGLEESPSVRISDIY